MIIVDTQLQKREDGNRPVRVAIIGAGYMGRGIAHQFLRPVTGMRLAGISNRTISEAARAYTESGIDAPRPVSSAGEVEKAIAAGSPLITEDWTLLCDAESVDVVLEATGEVEFGAQVAMRAIENGKHVVLMNAEVDATFGPMLKVYADKAGVVVTNTDGDEPGVAMNLVRFARTIGYEPVAAGNIKGMIDHYRTPDTQRAFAEKYNQKPIMITSFADGTKLSMETTVLANATGFGVGQPGMFGLDIDHVKETLDFFKPEHFENGGLVDYTIGAEPHTGAWVIGYNEDPMNQQYMGYFKMGEGPYYCFYTPYHLPHLQIITTVARAALFADATVTPLGKPSTDVVTMAKRDLKAGEKLDGIGGFCTYGNIENADGAMARGSLPMGLSDGCVVKRDLKRDHILTYADVTMPAVRLADRLRAEQDDMFFPRLRRKKAL
jgi:predicted homoserine dehydrogenase-like protein